MQTINDKDLNDINGGGVIQTTPAMPGFILVNAIIKWLQK